MKFAPYSAVLAAALVTAFSVPAIAAKPVAPAPAASSTPKPSASASPQSLPSASEVPVVSASPSTGASPAVGASAQPVATAPAANPAAVPAASLAPAPAASIAPAPTASLAPAPNASLSPAPTASIAPAPTASIAPAPNATISPVAAASGQPVAIASTVPRTLVPLIDEDAFPAALGRVYAENHPDALITGTTFLLNAAVDRQFAHEGGLAAFVAELILATPVDLDGAILPLSRAVRLRGGKITSNLSTSRVTFTIEGRSARTPELIRALAQAVEAPSFDRENIEVSRAALLAHITELAHDPVSVGQRVFRSAFYRDSVQRTPFIGTRAEVSVLTPAQLHAFYERAYKRGGAIVSIAGAATPEVRAAARDLLDVLPVGDSGAVKLNGWPALMPNSTVIASADVRTPVFVLGYKAPAFDSPDFAPMYVLSSILQSSLTRENVTTSIEQIYRPFIVNYDYQSAPANLTVLMNSSGDGLMEAARSLVAVGALLSNRRLDVENVGSFKRTAAGRYITEITEAGLESRRIATLTAAGFGPDAADAIMRRVDAVTPEDLQRVARRYLANPTYARVVPREDTRR